MLRQGELPMAGCYAMGRAGSTPTRRGALRGSSPVPGQATEVVVGPILLPLKVRMKIPGAASY